MSDDLDELRELLRYAPGFESMMGNGGLAEQAESVPLLERGAAIADARNESALAMQARRFLIKAAYNAGEPEKALVVFSWCLSQVDRNPDFLPLRDELLWLYKWLIELIPLFPQIPRQRIEAALDDMEQRYRDAGYSLRPVEMNRQVVAVQLGDWDTAAHHAQRWRGMPRDSMADCAACELTEAVRYLVNIRQFEQAFAEAAPLLKGRLRCISAPQTTFSRLLIPALATGKWELAAECHRRGIAKDSRDARYLHARGYHLAYMAAVGNLTAAVNLFERSLPLALETRNISARLEFHVGVRIVFRRIQQSRGAEIRLRLPEQHPLYRPDATYRPADLAQFWTEEVQKIAESFDRRNGNDSITRSIEERERRVELASAAFESEGTK